MTEVCSVQRPSGDGYDYYSTNQAPKTFASPSAAPGLAALADSLPALPPDAQRTGSGEVARGVMCTRGERHGTFGFWQHLGAEVVAGVLLYMLFSKVM